VRTGGVFVKLGAGAMLGLSLLCSPLAFALVPVVFVFMASKKIRISDLSYIVGAAAVIITPWTVRNVMVHKRIVPITTQYGENFWIGNNTRATGTDYYRVQSISDGNFVLMTQTFPRHTKRSLGDMSEIKRSDFFLNEGITFVIQKPTMFLVLLLKKAYYYFWFSPSEINGSPVVHRYRIIYALFYAPLFICGFIGIVHAVRQKYTPLTLSFILFILCTSGTYILTHVGLIRYRIPVELVLILYAAFFLDCIARNVIPQYTTRVDALC
jgi:hypothetical protein